MFCCYYNIILIMICLDDFNKYLRIIPILILFGILGISEDNV